MKKKLIIAVASVATVLTLGAGVVYADELPVIKNIPLIANIVDKPLIANIVDKPEPPKKPAPEQPNLDHNPNAEIIKNGYIPILGNPGDPATVNSNPKTGVKYAEIDGGSGGRGITACYDPNVPRKPGENEVLVRGSMYGNSNGGYVCADPYNIRYEACSMVSEMNPCINGTFQLDNEWLLSIGVNTAEIRRQIEANKRARSTPPPPQPTPDPNTAS